VTTQQSQDLPNLTLLAFEPAPAVNVDIHTLLERPSGPPSPGNASTSSRNSSASSTGRDNATTSTIAPVPYPGVATNVHHHYQHQPSHQQLQYQPQLYHHAMQAVQYHQPYVPHPQHYPPPGAAYPGYPPPGMSDPRFPPHIPVTHTGTSNKRLAPPHPAASPAKKKLRGNGMKWEDISKHLPGRSAISCRLRFQNYLERRSEWDEEKKNKLARLYERYVIHRSS
jgi:hypothetical protein